MTQEELRVNHWNSWAAEAVKSGNYSPYMVGTDDPKEAADITAGDIRDMFSILPDITGMEVLEVAGGTGRITKELAKRAKHVTCIDMTEAFIEENKRTNGAIFSNITFEVMDATKIVYQPNSFDCIYVMWLLAYLSDKECVEFIKKTLKMLRPGGALFFRESHFISSVTRDKTENSAIYRNLKDYHDWYMNASFTDENGEQYCYKHVISVNSKTYTTLRKLPTLFNHLYIKCRVSERDTSLPDSINNNVYTEDCIQVYDNVIQNGFSMPGGLEAAKKWLSALNMKSGATALDVGCGVGGIHSYLLKELNADVTGIDVSVIACEKTVLRMASLQKNVGSVQMLDITTTVFPPNSFEYILVKDTLECITDKLLEKFVNWLKPNGILLVGGYFGDTDNGTKCPFILKQFLSDLAKCGFNQTSSVDMSGDFIGYIEEDITKLENDKDISTDTKQKFINSWSIMLSSLKTQQMQWVSVTAVKPE